VFTGYQRKIDVVNQTDTTLCYKRQIVGLDSPIQFQWFPIFVFQNKIRFFIEIFHGPVVIHGTILVNLVEFYQLFPRIKKLLLSRNKCHQSTKLQLSLDGQPAAQDKDQKRSHTGKKPV